MTKGCTAAEAFDGWGRHDFETAKHIPPLGGHEIEGTRPGNSTRIPMIINDVVKPPGEGMSWSATHMDGLAASSHGMFNVHHTDASLRRTALDLKARRVAFLFFSSEPTEPITDEEYLERMADAYMAILAEVRRRR